MTTLLPVDQIVDMIRSKQYRGRQQIARTFSDNMPAVLATIRQAKRLRMITEAEINRCFAAAKEAHRQIPPLERLRLALIAQAPPVVALVRSGRYRSQRQIADARGVTKSTISQVLKHAREQGMITKAECTACFRAARQQSMLFPAVVNSKPLGDSVVSETVRPMSNTCKLE